MFTGLIEDIGQVCEISSSAIAIKTKLDDIAVGDSVSVNGVCLTAVKSEQYRFCADYSPNTDKITNLSLLKKGAFVNLERALKLSSRLGGHIVSGHVDATAKIKNIEKLGSFFRVVFSLPKEIERYCADKGSIAIDGVSLTVSKIFTQEFEVFIIPQTFNNTIFKFKKSGDLVNIETDILAKYAQKALDKKDCAMSLEFLKENGF